MKVNLFLVLVLPWVSRKWSFRAGSALLSGAPSSDVERAAEAEAVMLADDETQTKMAEELFQVRRLHTVAYGYCTKTGQKELFQVHAQLAVGAAVDTR